MRGLVLEPCFRLSNQLTKSDDKRADDAGKNRGLLSVALAGLQFASIGEMNSRDISRPCGLLVSPNPFLRFPNGSSRVKALAPLRRKK